MPKLGLKMKERLIRCSDSDHTHEAWVPFVTVHTSDVHSDVGFRLSNMSEPVHTCVVYLLSAAAARAAFAQNLIMKAYYVINVLLRT